jgi:hypothetical protein
VTPLEPELYGRSYWMNIKVTEVPVIRAGTRTRNQSEAVETNRVNFWDLELPDGEPEIESAFDVNETSRMADALQLFFLKKRDTVLEFLNRVDESLAPDYKQYVPSEMWLNLILQRVESRFYRTQD